MVSHGILNKQDLVMSSLERFYLSPSRDKMTENLAKFVAITGTKSKISLRVIDWFCTNYAKKNNTSYVLMENEMPRHFIVHIEYKAELKAHSKKQFDPFCRRDRIVFYYTDKEYITTTVGQLNFFRWAISNKIVDYIEDHLDEIETDMNNCYKAVYGDPSKKSPTGERKKRHELSVSAIKKLNKHDLKIIVSFD